ncbi:MAG: HEAT repeat domain-containing protein [Syntrophomonas sp.]
MGGITNLIHDLNSNDEKTRAFAAEDIAYDGLAEGIPHLVTRLQIDTSRFVREVIVTSLKSMNAPELIEKVIPLLRSDDAFIRNAAIEILSARGEDAIDSIQKLLHDADKDVRKFALDVLFLLNDYYSADLIVGALDDSDVNNVITAVEYLGRLEAATHSSRISSVFKNTSNLLLRCTCLEALSIIGNNQSIYSVDEVYSDYRSISPLEQYSYLKLVASKGTEMHLPFIISLMKEKGEVMHKEIINALEGVLGRMNSSILPNEMVNVLESYMDSKINDINKYELLVLIGEFSNDDIYKILVKHLNPENRMVCLGAVEGLGIYNNKEAIPILTSLKSQVTDEEVLEIINRSIEQLSK